MFKTRSIFFILVGLVNISAYAQNVSFLNATDVLAGKCFNPAANMVDSANPNKLIIGTHTTLNRDSCIAATGSFYLRNMSDVLTMDVVAPAGYYISKIKYSLVVTLTTSRTGSAASNNIIIVAGKPVVISKTGTYQVDLSGASEKMTSVPVSLSYYGFVDVQGTLGGGTASLTEPVLEAEILPLP